MYYKNHHYHIVIIRLACGCPHVFAGVVIIIVINSVIISCIIKIIIITLLFLERLADLSEVLLDVHKFFGSVRDVAHFVGHFVIAFADPAMPNLVSAQYGNELAHAFTFPSLTHLQSTENITLKPKIWIILQ